MICYAGTLAQMSHNQSKSVNYAKLLQLYKGSPAARSVLDHLASRERNWRTTTVDRIHANVIQDNPSVSRADLISVFRELESCGCGTFKTGRKGHASRLEWHVQMVSVGRAAAGETDRVEQMTEEDTAEEESMEMLKHQYRLRRDITIIFELPTDLTTSEAVRISDFIRTLPFSKQ